MQADLELAATIRDKLSRRRSLRDVSVMVNGGEVRLTGIVATFYLRQEAIEGAKRVPGVQQLADEIRVRG